MTVYDYFEFIGYCANWTDWWPDEGIPPSAILGEGIDGYIDYKLLFKFHISAPGDPLPPVWFSWDDYISCNIIGTGYGLLTEHAANWGYTPGAVGMVKLHQMCLFKPQFNHTSEHPIHPKWDPVWFDLWPVETIEIHEIGWK